MLIRLLPRPLCLDLWSLVKLDLVWGFGGPDL
jgi:hypothetical protein